MRSGGFTPRGAVRDTPLLTRRIPYARQSIGAEDMTAVAEVLASDWLTQGPVVPSFEKALAGYCGAEHAVATSSASAALHLACKALGLGPGDVLWTSPITFVASANCGVHCGATVDFVDIDPKTFNISVKALEQKLEDAAVQRRLPKVLVPVHFSGQSCDMAAIGSLAKRYGFSVIEDASHALGGNAFGGPVGECRFSDVVVFSFHPVKIITTGEGGAALTNRADLAARIRLLRSHGITREAQDMEGPSEGPWYYEQVDLGFNYRMTDIQAALGLSQLSRLKEFVSRRKQLALRYESALADLPSVVPPFSEPWQESAWHLYVIQVPKARRAIFDSLYKAGIHVNVHYIPVHLQPFYRKRGFGRGSFPTAEAYYESALSLPLYVGLSESDQDYVLAQLRAAISCE